MIAILFIAGFLILLTLGILYLVMPGVVKPITEENDGPWNLAKAPAIPNVTNFTNNPNATLRVFYYIEGLPRTNTLMVDNLNTPTTFNPVTNTFDICPVNTNTNCNHPGFIKLLSLTNSFFIEVLNAPDASRPGLPKTQMVIQTQRVSAGQQVLSLETFSLPEFPIQKWVMLTIVRNGNRFNVYYNDRLVFSKNTTYVPYIQEGSGSFSEGGVRGTAKYLLATNEIRTSKDVQKDFVTMADTRGEPVEKLFQKLNISLCPSGECFSGPKIRPANPLIEWTSDVM